MPLADSVDETDLVGTCHRQRPARRHGDGPADLHRGGGIVKRTITDAEIGIEIQSPGIGESTENNIIGVHIERRLVVNRRENTG